MCLCWLFWPCIQLLCIITFIYIFQLFWHELKGTKMPLILVPECRFWPFQHMCNYYVLIPVCRFQSFWQTCSFYFLRFERSKWMLWLTMWLLIQSYQIPLNKKILWFNPSSYTKLWIKMAQNFDLQFHQFKVVLKSLK